MRTGRRSGWARHRAMIAILMGGAVGGGCRRATPEETSTFTFACPRGDTIGVRFIHDSALVTLPGDLRVQRLPRAISGSGARYSDGTLTLWNKGDSVFVMRGDSIVTRDCGVVR